MHDTTGAQGWLCSIVLGSPSLPHTWDKHGVMATLRDNAQCFVVVDQDNIAVCVNEDIVRVAVTLVCEQVENSRGLNLRPEYSAAKTWG